MSLGRILVFASIVGCGSSPPAIVVAPDAGAADAPSDAVGEGGDVGPSCAETCVPSGPCDRAACIDERCTHEDVADGIACAADASRICMSAECVERGCGDGWLELGSDGFSAEACDLGAGAEACDETCAPVPFLLAATGSRIAREDTAVAMDDRGAVLVVWVERDADADVAIVRLRALDRRLTSPAQVELARIPGAHVAVAPVLAGLGTGWAIAMEIGARTHVGVIDDALDVELRPFGEVALVTPAVAPLEDGFVVVAVDLMGDVSDPLGGLRAALFDDSGRPLGEPFVVASDTRRFESSPSVASSGGAYTVAWAESDPLSGESVIVSRAFAGRTPLGANVLRSDPEAYASQPRAQSFGEEIVLSWIASDAAGTHVISAGETTADVVFDLGVRIAETVPVEAPRTIGYVTSARGAVAAFEPALPPTLGDVHVSSFLPMWARGVGGWLVAWHDPARGLVGLRHRDPWAP